MSGAKVVEWGPLRFEENWGSGMRRVRMTLLVEDEETRGTYVTIADADYYAGLIKAIEAMFPWLAR